MCDHHFYCDVCEDIQGDAELFKQRSKTYRTKCVSLNAENDTLRKMRQEDATILIEYSEENERLRAQLKHLEGKQCALKKLNKEHKRTNRQLEEQLQNACDNVIRMEGRVEAIYNNEDSSKLSEQVEMLRALNTHLNATCAARNQEMTKLQDAFNHIRTVCTHLDDQLKLFVEAFQRASSEDKHVEKKLLKVMQKLRGGK